jgi:hypothetical protein
LFPSAVFVAQRFLDAAKIPVCFRCFFGFDCFLVLKKPLNGAEKSWCLFSLQLALE